MPKLNDYTVTITLVQSNIKAETAADAIAVMESNIQIKEYVKPMNVLVERLNS